MALWDKGYEIDPEVLEYTVGKDYIVDLKLVPYDCRASAAHAKMLHDVGILNQGELEQLLEGFNEIVELWEKGDSASSRKRRTATPLSRTTSWRRRAKWGKNPP